MCCFLYQYGLSMILISVCPDLKIYLHNHDIMSVGGRRISNLRYADDTSITAENENQIQTLAERVNEEGNHFGMKMNIKKDKNNSHKQEKGNTQSEDRIRWARGGASQQICVSR